MKKLLCALSVSVLLQVLCFPNDGSYTIHGSGGAVFPVENDRIKMNKEVIHIDVYKAKTIYNYMAQYSCTFYFRNLTDQEQEVLLGFPVLHDYDYTGYSGETEKSSKPFRDFAFIIDDRNVDYKVYPNVYNPEKKEVPVYDEVYTAKITFLPGETKIVKNTYSLNKFITRADDPRGGTKTPSNTTLHYILRSGLTWKEPIGVADIIITFHDLPENFMQISGKPAGYAEASNPYTVSYHFENFKPKEDINLNFYYKYLPPDIAVNQINTYYKEGKKDIVLDLFYKYHDTACTKTIDKRSKDILRKAAFFIAGDLFKSDLNASISLYYHAFYYCYSIKNTPYYYKPDWFPSNREVIEEDYGSWEHEGENNAPCYYIAYNLACAYSKLEKGELAGQWLNAALTMKPGLKKIAETDSDLSFYREFMKKQR
ncbi:MAG: DUF4424 family protein [Spirochaetales bacterium]|nr:DUF4424 family protein [Spirochaetales bacterium]